MSGQHVLVRPAGVRPRLDGILAYEAPSHATAATANAFFDDVARHASGRAGVRLLIDASNQEEVDASARQVIYRRGAELREVQVAVIAPSRLQRAVVTFLAMAARLPVRCFDRPKEAERWLTR